MKQVFGIDVPQTLEDVCDRSKLALLVYDMQVGIVSQLKAADAVTALAPLSWLTMPTCMS